VKFVFLFTLATALATAQPPSTVPQALAEPEPPPVKFSMIHVEALKPQVVRICYLDEGTREIVLPPVSLPVVAQSAQPAAAATPDTIPAEANPPQVIRILNADEGTREIVVTPKS
jgi:hypothetical protein